MPGAAFGALGSELTRGGAAGGLQQKRQVIQVSEDRSQPNAAIGWTLCLQDAATAKPSADLPESGHSSALVNAH